MMGAPHRAFCVGQKHCDKCKKEYPGAAAEHLELCDLCRGVFCRHEGVDGCFETHECFNDDDIPF